LKRASEVAREWEKEIREGGRQCMVEAIVVVTGHLERSQVELGESLQGRRIVIRRGIWVPQEGVPIGVQEQRKVVRDRDAVTKGAELVQTDGPHRGFWKGGWASRRGLGSQEREGAAVGAVDLLGLVHPGGRP